MSERNDHSALKLVLSYDGARFAGSQRQLGQRTVQGELERALSILARGSNDQMAPMVFAGRTDSGVHAVGQVVSLPDIRPDFDEARFIRAINAQLEPDCAVVSLERTRNSFHARFDATWREYRYRVWVGSPQPLVRDRTWQRRNGLDIDRMSLAAAKLIGQQDFASFAGGGDGMPWSPRQQTERGTTRTVMVSEIREMMPWWADRQDGTLIEYRIVADGFLQKMVRTIVGTLVSIGHGWQASDWIDTLLEGRDRTLAAETAPPQGLTLWRVGYDNDSPDDGV